MGEGALGGGREAPPEESAAASSPPPFSSLPQGVWRETAAAQRRGGSGQGGGGAERGSFTFPHFLLQEAGPVTSSGLPGPAPFPLCLGERGGARGRAEGGREGSARGFPGFLLGGWARKGRSETKAGKGERTLSGAREGGIPFPTHPFPRRREAGPQLPGRLRPAASLLLLTGKSGAGKSCQAPAGVWGELESLPSHRPRRLLCSLQPQNLLQTLINWAQDPSQIIPGFGRLQSLTVYFLCC